MSILFPISEFSMSVESKENEIKQFMLQKLVGSKIFEVKSALNITRKVSYWGRFEDNKITLSRQKDSISTIPPYPAIEIMFSHRDDICSINVKCTLSLFWRVIIYFSYILCVVSGILGLYYGENPQEKILTALKGTGIAIFIIIMVHSYQNFETRNSNQIIRRIINQFKKEGDRW